MECKHCGSKDWRKNGFTRGFQRYNCRECKRNWTLRKSRAYDISVRFQALKLYLEGLGFRSIGRILNVSNVTVLKWIRSMGEKIFQEGAVWKNTKIRSVSRIQIDELWHYVQKNSIEFGFGLLYASKQDRFLPFFVETEQNNLQNSSRS